MWLKFHNLLSQMRWNVHSFCDTFKKSIKLTFLIHVSRIAEAVRNQLQGGFPLYLWRVLAKYHPLSRFKEFVPLWIITVGHCVEEDIIKQHYWVCTYPFGPSVSYKTAQGLCGNFPVLPPWCGYSVRMTFPLRQSYNFDRWALFYSWYHTRERL